MHSINSLRSRSDIPFIVTESDMSVEISEVFAAMTGYMTEELINRNIEDIFESLRIGPNVKPFSVDAVMDYFLFTKSLEVRFVNIEVIKEANELIFLFLEKTDSGLEDRLGYVCNILSDNMTGVAIYSAPDLTLLKVNKMYLDLIEPPYNVPVKTIGRKICDFISGFKNSSAEEMLRDIISSGKSKFYREQKYDQLNGDIIYRDEIITPVKEHGIIKYLVINSYDETERVQYKKKLQEQNELLRKQTSLLSLSTEAILAWDFDGNIIYWNKGAEQMYGYSSEEAAGGNIHSLLKTVFPISIDGIKYLLYRDGVWEGEIEHTTKGGKKLIVETNFQVIMNETGQRIVLESNHDITERKEYANKVNQQNIILNAINYIYQKSIECDSMEDLGHVCLDVIESITDSKFSIIGEITLDGLFHEIAVGNSEWQLHKIIDKAGIRVSKDKVKIHGLLKKVLLEGKSLLSNDPFSGYNEDDMLKEHSQLTSFLGVPFIRAGKAEGMIGVGNRDGGYLKEDQEILEVLTPTILEVLLRKRAETQLNESKMLAESQAKQMNVILENINEAIIVTDSNGNLFSLNPAALKLHGFSSLEGFANPREYSYSLEVATLDGKLIPHEEYAISKALRGETFTDYELSVHRRDIDRKWIGSYAGTPIYDRNGNLAMAIITIRDITQTIENQRKIKNQQEQLLKAEVEKNEALEKAIEMKDEFLSLISHEFRTPLNVINAAIQALNFIHADELSDKVKEYIATIKQNTFRQLRLVNNLLDITRANAGCIKIHKKNMDIVSLTREITGSVRQYASLKGVNLSFVSSVKSKVIGIDDEKYERILLNLLSNAIKFTPEGNGITVNLRSARDYVCIEVKDNGIGIQQDKLNIIFERFGQVDSSLSRQAEGTGIGLSLVKKFVEALGGSISVRSKLGKGSTFTVILPNCKVVEERNEKPVIDLLNNRLEQVANVEFSDIYL